ncbi:MAG TPA: ABC transporter ATP-binding protein [Rhizomicrobium sp.]|nr:ABC transporter ATP-binding protein [Rhizomicrobium sp.]
MNEGIKLQFKVLTNLIAYVIRIRPDSVFTVALGVLSSVLEVVGLAVLVPLTQLAAHQSLAPHSLWLRVAALLGFAATPAFYIDAFFILLILRTSTQLAATIFAHHLNRQLNGIFSIRALEAFVQHLSFADVQKESIGHFVSVAGEEAVRSAQIASSIARLIPLLALFVLYFAMITYQSWQTGLGFVLFALTMLACLWGAFKKSHELGYRSQIQSREAGTHFIETLSGLRTVRSFTAERYVTERYANMTRAYKRTLFLIDAINSVGGAVPTLFLTVAMLVALIYFIPQQQLAVMLPGIMVGIMMVLRLLPLTNQTLDVAMRLVADLKAAESVAEMLKAVKSRDEAGKYYGATVKGPIRKIEFDNVCFRYDASLPIVLKNFSATFQAGKSYAISGPSGSGKSTIIDLLLKFYQKQSGAIRINGHPIDDLADEAIRQRVVLSEQAVRIFFDTIANNVRFGYDGNSDVTEPLELVGLGDFLRSMPEGVETMMAFQGGNVSGGQRQRIGLARALLRHADVLIMDESTSALDLVTRETILSNIIPRYRDKILIFVAHDPAILERVDEVIYLTPSDEPVPVAV